VLAVVGGKGGTGKTTTALGLARAFDDPAVVVDADVDMPDLHLLAGVDREPTLSAVADGARPAAVAHDAPDAPGVSVLPAPARTDGGGRPVRDVGPGLARAAAAPGRVVVDCPGGAGPDAAAPLRAADRAVAVASADPAALRGAAKTAATARALGTPVAGVVVTRTGSAPASATDLLGCPVLGAVPTVDPPVLADRRARAAYTAVSRALGRVLRCEDI
jgi:septum site-determining protein MinD